MTEQDYKINNIIRLPW